jgi:hypothetical protein
VALGEDRFFVAAIAGSWRALVKPGSMAPIDGLNACRQAKPSDRSHRDRMYLNVYVPRLQMEQGIAWFFREHRGQPVPSAALITPMSRGFVAALDRVLPPSCRATP